MCIYTHTWSKKGNEEEDLDYRKLCLWLFFWVSHLTVWTEGALCWREDKVKALWEEWGIFKKENKNHDSDLYGWSIADRWGGRVLYDEVGISCIKAVLENKPAAPNKKEWYLQLCNLFQISPIQLYSNIPGFSLLKVSLSLLRLLNTILRLNWNIKLIDPQHFHSYIHFFLANLNFKINLFIIATCFFVYKNKFLSHFLSKPKP